MATGQVALSRKKDYIDYIQIINDILLVFFICVVYALANRVKYIETIALLLLFSVTLLNAYLKGRKINILCLWAIVFYGYCLISGLWAYSATGASRSVKIMMDMIILFITISLYINEKKAIDTILKGFIIGAMILSIRLIISTPFDQFGVERLGRTIGINENTIGMTFAFASTICLNYVKKTNIYSIVYVLFATLSILSGSRKAFILILLVIFLFLINKIKKPSNIIYIIPFGSIFYLLIYLSLNNPLLYHMIGRRMEFIFNYFSGEGEVGNSTAIRMDLINIGLEQFKSKVLIGYGLNSFQFMNKYRLYAHNNYIELLVNNGIIGTFLYYIMPISILIKACIIWIKKSREVFLAIVFISMMLISDYGKVSYYSIYTLILLIVSYYIIAFSDG